MNGAPAHRSHEPTPAWTKEIDMTKHLKSVTVFAPMLAAACALMAAAPAQAAALFLSSDTCDVQLSAVSGSSIPTFNHVFMHAYDPVAGGAIPSRGNLYTIWGAGTSWNWQLLDNSPEVVSQLACAATQDQAIVVYRDGSGNAKARDRRSGWGQSSILTPGGGYTAYPLWATTYGTSAGVTNFVLFGVARDGHLYMTTSTPVAGLGWSSPIDLGAVPGGVGVASQTSLGGYGYFLITNGVGDSMVSVFLVSDAGTLIENRGPIVAARRVFIDHGHPASGTLDIASRPVASSTNSSPFGHPGDVVEGEYIRRLTVAGANGGIFALTSTGTLDGRPWETISTAAVPWARAFAGDLIRGCPGFGTCVPYARTVGITITANVPNVADYIFMNNIAGPNGPWNPIQPALPFATNSGLQVRPTLVGVGMEQGQYLMYVAGSNSLMLYSFLTRTMTSLGHP
jgi:hypothetical protein